MRKTPHNIGNINSFLTRIAITEVNLETYNSFNVGDEFCKLTK